MSQYLDDLKRRKQMYVEAEEAILIGSQEYKVGGRVFTRANLKEVQDMIRELEKRISQEDPSATGGRRLGSISSIRVIPKND